MSGTRLQFSRERYTSRNSVRLLISGKEYFECFEQLILEAQYEIHLQTYIFEPDDTGNRIAAALIEAAGNGVKIFLLMDAYGSQNLDDDLEQEMKSAGIIIRKYGKLYSRGRFHIGRRLHRKVMVVDGHIAVVGGMNISDHYNDLPGKKAWLDFAVVVQGMVCKRLQRICQSRWKKKAIKNTQHKERASELQITPDTFNDVRIKVSQNDFMRQKNETANTYRNAIRTSTSKLLIVGGYFLPGGNARRSMRNATRRGVKIQLLVPEKSDVLASILARRYLYSWLLRNNIEIYEYPLSNVHGKVLVCDSKFVSVGSYDLNNLSTYSNIELNLDIENESFATHVEAEINQIIKRDCNLITTENFSKTHSWIDNLVEWFAYRFVKTLFVLSVWLAKRDERDY